MATTTSGDAKMSATNLSENLNEVKLNANTIENMVFVDDKDAQMVPKILQPKNHKAVILTWADLSITDMDVLDQLTTPDAIQAELARIFHLDDQSENRRIAILLDLYYYTLQFARDNSFSKEQTSAFFSIVKRTHEVCIETPYGNLENCFQYFRDLVLCHAVRRPPFSIDLFTPDDVKLISEYVINTYFRNFKLYKYIFTSQVRLDLSFKYIGLPPSPPASLDGDQANGEEGLSQLEDPSAEEELEEKVQEEESAAASELRRLIRQHLSEEIKRLKASIDQQIKQSEEEINKKLHAAETQKTTSSPRATAKAKKK